MSPSKNSGQLRAAVQITPCAEKYVGKEHLKRARALRDTGLDFLTGPRCPARPADGHQLMIVAERFPAQALHNGRGGLQRVPAEAPAERLIGWPITSIVVQSLVVGAVAPSVRFKQSHTR